MHLQYTTDKYWFRLADVFAALNAALMAKNDIVYSIPLEPCYHVTMKIQKITNVICVYVRDLHLGDNMYFYASKSFEVVLWNRSYIRYA